MQIFTIRDKNCSYKFYIDNNKVLLYLDSNNEEKFVGMYLPSEKRIIKSVADKNYFKKYGGFGIGKIWIDIIQPREIYFKYRKKFYRVIVNNRALKFAELVKYDMYEFQYIFPKRLCKKLI